jgi:hypothetical protein
MRRPGKQESITIDVGALMRVWGAHASTRVGDGVLAVANFPQVWAQGHLKTESKFVSARRCNQHA